MHAISLLEADHREIKRLLRELEELGNAMAERKAEALRQETAGQLG